MIYITIALADVNEDFALNLSGRVNLGKYDHSLVYVVDTNYYFISTSIPIESRREIVCTSQNEFIRTVEHYKLLKLIS